MKTKKCPACGISGSFPGVHISGSRCNYCRERAVLYRKHAASKTLCYTAPLDENTRNRLFKQMDSYFRRMAADRTLGVMAYSGGIDSTYVLDTLVNKYRLNIIPVTVDVGAMDERALSNIKHTLKKLGIRKSVFVTRHTPRFLKVFDYFFTHLDDLPVEGYNPLCCMVCHHLIDLVVHHEARAAGAEYIVSGLDRFQTPPELNFLLKNNSFFLDIDPRTHFDALTRWWPRAVREKIFGAKTMEAFRKTFTKHKTPLKLITPTWFMDYRKEEVREYLVSKGIILHTAGTNCKFKPLANALFMMKHGYGINEFVESSKVWEKRQNPNRNEK